MIAKRKPVRQEPESKGRLRLWLKMLKTTRLIEAEMRERLRTQFDSTLPRFDVMAALNRYPGGLKMSELSDVLKVSNGNVTGIVDRLVKCGLIVRVAVAGDRRASLVRLTSKGSEEFARQAAAHESWIDDLLGDLPPHETQAMVQRLDDLLGPAGEKELT